MTINLLKFNSTSLKLLIFVSLALPQLIPKISFFLTLLIVFVNLAHSKLFLERSMLATVILGGFAVFGLYGSLLGVFFSNDIGGIYANLKVNLFYSMLGLVLIPLMKRSVSIDDVFQVVLISCIFIFLSYMYPFLSLYFGFNLTLIPYAESIIPTVSLYMDRYVISIPSVANLIILFPIVLFRYFDKNNFPKHRFIYFLILVSLILLILISGRRMVWILSSSALVGLVYFLSRDTHKKIFFWLFSLSILYSVSFQVLFDFFMISSEVSTNESVRLHQLNMLLDSFFTHPFGLGFGSLFYDNRGYETWLFELVWMKMLADIGIIFCLWIIIFIVMFVYHFHNRMKRFFKLYLVGFYASLAFWFLIGFSNPPFSNFDGFIILFVLLSVIEPIKRTV